MGYTVALLLALATFVATTLSLTIVPAGKLPLSLTNTVALPDFSTTTSILILGGQGESDEPGNGVLRYNLATETVEKVGEFPYHALYGGAAILETTGRIYYSGGMKVGNGFRTYSSEIYELSPWNPSPVVVAQLPQGIAFHCSIYDGTRSLYTISGANEVDYESQIFYYNTASSTQKTFASSNPIRRTGAPCIGHYDMDTYIFGGVNADSGYVFLNTILKANVVTGKVETLDVTLPVAVYMATAVRVGNFAYIIGGQTADPNVPHYVTRFNLDTHEITEMKPIGMVPSLYGASAVYMHSLRRIYVFGGHSRSAGGAQNKVFYIQLD